METIEVINVCCRRHNEKICNSCLIKSMSSTLYVRDFGLTRSTSKVYIISKLSIRMKSDFDGSFINAISVSILIFSVAEGP